MQKRAFLKSLGLLSASLPLASWDSAHLADDPKVLLPKAIKKGDTIGLISPSAATADRMQFTYAKEALEALGFEVMPGKNLMNRRGHLAGTDEERAGDLNEMFADNSVKAIVSIRGGSGAARILPLIDYKTIARNPKPLLGYSDITALHCAIQAQTGLITFHGPMGSGSWNSFNVTQFEKIFFDQEKVTFENIHSESDDLVVKSNRIQTLKSGKAEGKILGGNLTVLTAISGSLYYPDFTDAILFIEDIGEDPYKIDRMMSTLKLNGTLNKIKGFIFGQCSDCEPGGGYGSLTLDQVLDDYVLPLDIPAYSGAMIGHISKQFIIPVGARVTMDADKGTISMLESVFQ
ncbi:LD-carboxypeptidase [Algoriphagus sp. Y33]|uniref:S66 peptidase family protein n=1 Tax=Algoriphagus sp. Y33 TaxID=2772483 RepID=UPI0017802AD6|nr:LD-carboxypeptidase [Algoriphagus sp. Y33]